MIWFSNIVRSRYCNGSEEIIEYIQQLQDLDDQNYSIKRSFKGEANLDSIQRKITINKWNLEGQSEGRS